MGFQSFINGNQPPRSKKVAPVPAASANPPPDNAQHLTSSGGCGDARPANLWQGMDDEGYLYIYVCKLPGMKIYQNGWFRQPEQEYDGKSTGT